MKRLTLKLSALTIVVLGAPMLIPGPDGKPLMSLDDWIPTDLIAGVRGGVETVSDTINNLDTDSATPSGTVYRWVDEQGVVHFSDTPVEGAEPTRLTAVDMEVSAREFVHQGMPKVKRKIVESASNRGGEVSLKDVEALVGGDLNRVDDVLGNMPELLEQAKKARQIDPAAR